MATTEQIQLVKDGLPPEAASLGWTDVKIAAQIDSGLSPIKTIRSFWAFRVAQTSDFVNISESGSSRTMEDVWKHAMEMLKYWDGRVAKEDGDDGVIQPRQRISFHSATRV